MCRFCYAVGPICRYVSDPDFAETTVKGVPFVPPYPDDLLADLPKENPSGGRERDSAQRPSAAAPKAARKRKQLETTGASPPKPGVFAIRLHWPALASGSHSPAALCVPGAQTARAPPNVWCEPGAGLPNSAEVLCYAFLLVCSAADDKEAVAWAEKVLSTAPARTEPAQEQVVLADPWWQRRGKHCALAYEPLRVAIRGTAWQNFELDRVGAAMQRWRGDGRCDGLGHSELRSQTRTDSRKLMGPKNAHGNSRPRYEHAIFEVAKLVKQHGKRLRKEGRSDEPPGPTMAEEIAQLKKEAKKNEADLEVARLNARRAGDSKRQLKSRLIAKRSAVSKARKEERDAAAAKVKAAKALRDKQLHKKIDATVERLVDRRVAREQLSNEQRIAELIKQRARARERARSKEQDAKLSQKRLHRAQVICAAPPQAGVALFSTLTLSLPTHALLCRRPSASSESSSGRGRRTRPSSRAKVTRVSPSRPSSRSSSARAATS